ncbi:MAG TPA: terminase small subunit [Acetobacteraceae bacterium]|nr:terminase small subunit [Acetobacteraceae bacterium]
MSLALSTESDLRLTKRELHLKLGVSRPTLDAWIDRYPDFPIVERGTNGTPYRFDPAAVIAFLRAKQDEQAKRNAERDEQLAQLVLPLDRPGSEPGKIISAEERLKEAKANAAEIALGKELGTLVQVGPLEEKLLHTFGELNRHLTSFIRQLAREQNWPEPILLDAERRLAEMQRGCRSGLAEYLNPIEAEAHVAHHSAA